VIKINPIMKNPGFAYLTGYFMSDGSFYKEKKTNRHRFEFTDGYIEKEGLPKWHKNINARL
jgi:hypothetical protein